MNVLVVAAHPDDEILGCGGTIARHAAAGDAVSILILGEGATARDPERRAPARADEIEALRESARSAASVLGVKPPQFCGFPDNRMDETPLLDIIKRVETAVGESQPAIVYTHHAGDLNVDHRIAHETVLTACRPLPGANVRRIYAFETVSSTEWQSRSAAPFESTRFVDISGFLEAKLKALACYRSEMRAFPHPRSLENITALANLRGASVGLLAAEAFAVVREVVAAGDDR